MSARRTTTALLARLVLGLASALVGIFIVELALAIWGGASPSDRVEHTPNVEWRRETLEFDYVFRTNSRGIRDVELGARTAGSRDWRLVAAGDSYTEGHGVDDAETWASLLEREWQGGQIHVVNCGVSGTGPVQYARTLHGACMHYEPDAVLVLLYANDATDTPPGIRETWVPGSEAAQLPGRGFLRRLLPNVTDRLSAGYHSLRALRGPVWMAELEAEVRGIPSTRVDAWRAAVGPELLEAADTGRLEPFVVTTPLLRPEYWRESLDLVGEGEARFEPMLHVLDGIVEYCRDRDVPVAFALAPSSLQYQLEAQNMYARLGLEVDPGWLDSQTEFERRVGAWAERTGVPYLDLTPHFRTLPADERAQLNFALDGHWTAEGHAYVADLLRPWLRSNGLLPQEEQ